MTTLETFAGTPLVGGAFVFPDPPGDPEGKMTNFDHLSATGNAYRLIEHLGDRGTTLVAGEHYLALAPTRSMAGVRYPDLLVAFGVDPEAYRRSNAYVVSEQGKAPDFVLEVASRSTGRVDVGEKRADYARLGVGEYWRFDETGEHHGARLAGDRLVQGRYEPVAVEAVSDGVLEGYSPVLGLHLRWEDGALVFCDPATGRPIAGLEDERPAREAQQARADTEQARAEAAEARVRELEGQLRRHGE